MNLSRDELTRDELRRYSRQLLLPEFAQAQASLQAARVLIVGLGGLGSPVLQFLTGAGVGTLRLSDPDAVGLSNLHRQTGYALNDLDKPKTEVSARWVTAHNPAVQVEVCPAFSAENADELLTGVSLAVDASDNFDTRYTLSDACVRLGLPMVWGAAAGVEGMVSVFANATPQPDPTGLGLRALFPAPDLAEDCATLGVLGPLTGVVGSVMATEALKVLTGVGETLTGRLWVYDALSGRVRAIGY